MKASLPANPLPSCPSRSFNCVRETRVYDFAADTLFDRAREALVAIGAASVTPSPETRHLAAVFKVFIFEDDVAIAVEPYETGAALHIRSASRVGNFDFGVNRRRVKRFFKALPPATRP